MLGVTLQFGVMLSPIDTDPILAEIEAFIASAAMSATQFGYLALGDPALVHELRRGRECRRRTRSKIMSFIAQYRQNPIDDNREDRPNPHAPIGPAPL